MKIYQEKVKKFDEHQPVEEDNDNYYADTMDGADPTYDNKYYRLLNNIRDHEKELDKKVKNLKEFVYSKKYFNENYLLLRHKDLFKVDF